MKVLFAVSNDNVSASIIKKYQEKYKEIITSKNVYFFNAIIKELQKDKTYDAIVIGEDLEPISNNNYDAMDKFLFEKLDNISDEAYKVTGEDIPIILICSDRRTKSDGLLIKLFGIGIYNALLDNDRNVDMVCTLINKPRSKKEAKNYYRVDSEDVNYKPENESEVSETEIKNILNHYKKIGNNEKKCVESFDSISSQYNDTQLRIIIKFLPNNVKSILEKKSQRYQKLVNGGTVLTGGGYTPYSPLTKQVKPKDMDFIATDIEKPKLTQPVVIPSTMNINQSMPVRQENNKIANIDTNKVKAVANPYEFSNVQNPNMESSNSDSASIEKETKNIDLEVAHVKRRGRPRKVNIEAEKSNAQDNNLLTSVPEVQSVKRGRGRPKKINVVAEDLEQNNGVNSVNQKNTTTTALAEQNSLNLFELDNDVHENTNIKDETNQNSINGDDINLFGIAEDNTVQPQYDQSNIIQNSYVNNMTQEQNPYANNMTQEQNPYANNMTQEQNSYTSNIVQEQNPYVNNMTQEQNSYVNNMTQEQNPYTSNIVQEQNPYANNMTQEQNPYTSNIVQEQNPYTNNMTQEQNYYGVENTREISMINNQTNSVPSNFVAQNKIVAFVGTSKNGTSFIVNNLAELLSQKGIKTAILDLTKNKNSYYMFTDNDQKLMQIATQSIKNLENGIAQGVEVNKNLTVYTALPDEFSETENVETILQTLDNNYSAVLMDCDFNTNINYFIKSTEIYLVQSMDALTIQPLTQFLSELKLKNILEESKLRVVINKELKLKILNDKMILGGMAKYNEPSMTLQRDLFNPATIKYVTIPFEMQTYARYLEAIALCQISLSGYSANFMTSLENLANMVYPLISGGAGSNYTNYSPNYAKAEKKGFFKSKNRKQPPTQFSAGVNGTLDKMRANY